jgi:hypothetical protein
MLYRDFATLEALDAEYNLSLAVPESADIAARRRFICSSTAATGAVSAPAISPSSPRSWRRRARAWW